MERITEILHTKDLVRAARMLRDGECVAFPTETVYGLGANAWDAQAVQRIFTAKGRPADNPLIVHCHSQDQLESVVRSYPDDAKRLMDRFWPGPLSLVLPKSKHIPAVVSAGLDSVAMRIPDHPVALELLRLARIPIAAPSANISGRPSPTRATHVQQDLNGKIAAIVDGGRTGYGLESTVLDCTCNPFRLLRPGGITLEQLQTTCFIHIDPGIYGNIKDKPRSPGMKYQHYSPDAFLVLVVGENIGPAVQDLIKTKQSEHKKIGVMTVTEHVNDYQGVTVLDMGSNQELETVASRIYHLLRHVDALGLEYVIVEGLPETHIGMAIMNRLRKAAGYRIITT